jgi:hypothetical protein
MFAGRVKSQSDLDALPSHDDVDGQLTARHDHENLNEGSSFSA